MVNQGSDQEEYPRQAGEQSKLELFYIPVSILCHITKKNENDMIL